MTRDIRELAKEVLSVQAMNIHIRVVLRSFAEAMKDLEDNVGDENVHAHPISKGWAIKVNSLTGIGKPDDDHVCEVFTAISTILEIPDPPDKVRKIVDIVPLRTYSKTRAAIGRPFLMVLDDGSIFKEYATADSPLQWEVGQQVEWSRKDIIKPDLMWRKPHGWEREVIDDYRKNKS